MEKDWKLYILRCRDGSLYTGITTDVQKRQAAHNCGKGAKYTRSRRPVELVYQESCKNHSEALRREIQVKTLTREEKEKMIAETRL